LGFALVDVASFSVVGRISAAVEEGVATELANLIALLLYSRALGENLLVEDFKISFCMRAKDNTTSIVLGLYIANTIF
jgi:hypothetical protein